ncbi:ryncolin-1-like [Dendronephthya gigantea]|uniref:ryncolin-1-like n=1 Tax=Dendronephthya gigantea TaxID=151771 RepID=UPI00106B80D3|nr:ryncolin-1-like [Dendronephthya gigantea]XP_028418004.1 ryncolin-1-like [Dendronephthya gigantea]
MTTDGGDWTVFQEEVFTTILSSLEWSDYKAGFGDLNGEFWLGLDKINLELMKLNLTLLKLGYAKYGVFSVADESDKYRLSVGDYSVVVGCFKELGGTKAVFNPTLMACIWVQVRLVLKE